MQLKEIINNIKKSCEETGIYPTHDKIIDCATRIYNTSNMNDFKPIIETDTTKPTAKQIETLKKFHVPITEDLTKDEATQIIGEKIEEIKNKE